MQHDLPVAKHLAKHLGRRITGAAVCFMLLVIAAYALLLRRSAWHGDEYIMFAFQREAGWRFLSQWYLTWSPRLISDMLFAAYGFAVTTFNRPFAGACMAVLWGLLFLACTGPAMAAAQQRPMRLLLGLTVFALCLVGHGVSEVFYWPAGGLSYIPTLTGMIWLFWCLADGGSRPKWQACAALVLIAGSSEVGIFVALSVGALMTIGSRRRIAALWWLLPGLAVGLLDLALVVHGRVGIVEIASTGPLLHSAAGSLAAAIPIFAREFIVPDNARAVPIDWIGSCAARLLVVLAARWSLAPGHPRQYGLLLPFAAALLAGSFASIVSSLYEFGELCCERHDTMRACSIMLALIAFGLWSAGRWPVAAPRCSQAALAWIAAVGILFLPSSGGLIQDWRTARQAVSAHAQTWASGSAAADGMVMSRAPNGHITGGDGFHSGEYRASDKNVPWYDFALLRFFHKQTVIINNTAALPASPP